MRIKQMANEIKEQIPKELNELEVLRYIYIWLGKRKTFDPEYFFGNSETRKKIYNLNKKRIVDEEYLTSNKRLLCNSIASTLRLLGKEFDIQIECMQDEFGVGAHVYNMARLKDGRNIYLDLQQDLKHIHTGDRTENFGFSSHVYDIPHTTLDRNTLEIIDEKIGYKEPDKPYRGERLQSIVKEIITKTVLEEESDSVRELLNNEQFNNELKNPKGYVEQEQFVEGYLDAIGAGNAGVITCYRDEDVYKQPLQERQYSMCVFANGIDIYMFKQKEKRFVEISLERMSRLIDQGLKINKSIRCKHYAVKLENLLNIYSKRKKDKEL